jgi:hypothetical protein
VRFEAGWGYEVSGSSLVRSEKDQDDWQAENTDPQESYDRHDDKVELILMAGTGVADDNTQD